jgi:hypothetical protein
LSARSDRREDELPSCGEGTGRDGATTTGRESPRTTGARANSAGRCGRSNKTTPLSATVTPTALRGRREWRSGGRISVVANASGVGRRRRMLGATCCVPGSGINAQAVDALSRATNLGCGWLHHAPYRRQVENLGPCLALTRSELASRSMSSRSGNWGSSRPCSAASRANRLAGRTHQRPPAWRACDPALLLPVESASS